MVAELRADNALIQDMAPGYHFATHMHRTVEIFICLAGRITISVQGAPQIVEAGDYLLVFPNVLHSCEVSPDGPCRLLQMHFYHHALPQPAHEPPPSGELGFTFELSLDKRKFFQGQSTPQLSACLEGVRAELTHQLPGGKKLVATYLSQLNIFLSRDMDARSPNGRLYENRYLVGATLFIGAHFSEKLTVGAVAEYVGISTRYLARLFREELKLGVSTYITYVRISKSIDFMFANPNYPLTRLALEMGFSSLQHFSKIFKEKMGVSPKKYFSIRPI